MMLPRRCRRDAPSFDGVFCRNDKHLALHHYGNLLVVRRYVIPLNRSIEQFAHRDVLAFVGVGADSHFAALAAGRVERPNSESLLKHEQRSVRRRVQPLHAVILETCQRRRFAAVHWYLVNLCPAIVVVRNIVHLAARLVQHRPDLMRRVIGQTDGTELLVAPVLQKDI